MGTGNCGGAPSAADMELDEPGERDGGAVGGSLWSYREKADAAERGL
jgi:hypothetical protein